MANKITTVVEFVTDKAQSSIGKFRTDVANAEGTVGKFKAGASAAFSQIQAHAAAFALSAGAALVGFGVKAVGAFQDVALEAGKFSDATGLAVEDASRWLEVAGDVGVSAELIEGAFVKLNKEIGAGNPILEQYGVHLITAADGTADVNETMLTAIKRIGAIQDPTKRAEAAQAAFGRGYKEAAEIILGNADQIKRKLDEVSDAKVIDQEELDKARRLREALDNVKDIAEDLTLAVGEGLVPALTDVAEVAGDIRSVFGKIPKAPWIVEQWWDKASPLAWQRHTIDGIGKVGGAIKGVFGGGGDAPEAFKYTTAAADLYVESLEQMHTAVIKEASAEQEHERMLDKVRGQAERYVDLLEQRGLKVLADIAAATDRARRANKLHADSVNAQRDAVFDSLGTMFDYEKAQRDSALAVDDLRTTLAETPGDLRAVRDAQIEAGEAALNQSASYAAEKGAIEGSTLAAHLQIDELERLKNKYPELAPIIQGYIDKLNEIPSVKSTQLVVTSTGAVTTKQTIGAGGRLVAAAEGAVVKATPGGVPMLVAEGGHDEAIVPLSGPHAPGGMGGTTIVYAPQIRAEVGVDVNRLARLLFETFDYGTRNGFRLSPTALRVIRGGAAQSA